jgi:DNA-directed RNA polymerase beta subunit
MFGAYIGQNQEDGIILTESAAKKFTLMQTVGIDHTPTYDASFVTPQDLDRFNEFGIIRVGQKVEAGDDLFTYYEYPDERDAQVRLAASLLTDAASRSNALRRIRQVKAPLDIERGIVEDVKVYLNYADWKDNRTAQMVHKPLMLRTAKDPSVEKFVDYYIREEDEYKRRYKAISNHVPKPYEFAHADTLFTVIITIKYMDTMAMHRLGGKITNYYGSKGVNTYIIPDEEAPYDELGNKIECILSAVALYSRNNPAQITECKLGLCCLEGWKMIQKNGIDSDKAKKFLKEFYPDGKYNPDQVMKDGNKYGYIRAIAGPFDDFYSIGKIKQLLELLGLGSGDQKVFFPKFNRWTQQKNTVGLVNMIRLHFLQSKKAKVTADVNLDTDEDNISYMGVQKDQGQKMGAQEVWALMAHGQKKVLSDIQQGYDSKEAKFESALLMLGMQLRHGPDKSK